MSYGYGGRPNPYDQRGAAPTAPQGGYDSAQQYNAAPAYGRSQYDNGPSMGRDDFAARTGQNVEMEPLAPNGSQFGSQNDPNHILNECRDIDRGIDQIKANLNNLTTLQQRALDDPDSSAQSSTNRQLDALSSETMTMYRNFAGRIRVLKSQPDSGSPKNAPQVGRVDRSLKTAIQEYQSLDSAFRKKLQDQMARQYRIVRSDATDDEVRRAVEATSSQQVFSQALLQSDRRGQSRAALNAVENRHAAIQKIESQIIELAKLFEDMDVLVVQQEAAVINVEDQGVRIVDDLNKGTQQLNTAVVSAKNARKWKWWCLGICVLIIIIIIVVVLIYKFVIQTPAKTKRWLIEDSLVMRSVADAPAAAVGRRTVVPGLEWTAEDKLEARYVVPGKEWVPEEKRAMPFVA